MARPVSPTNRSLSVHIVNISKMVLIGHRVWSKQYKTRVSSNKKKAKKFYSFYGTLLIKK